MWTRNPQPNTLANVYVTGLLRIGINNDPGIYWSVDAGNRTTWGLQVQPRFANTWGTSGSGAEQFTFAEYPGGFIHVTGIVSNSTAANRADATYCFDLNLTTFATRFTPAQEIHMLADGRDRANNQQPVFVLGIDGNARCYNLDTATAGAVDYRINAVYNKFTMPGKYENTGGGPL